MNAKYQHSILFSLLILFGLSSISTAQNVSIPDAYFKAVLVGDSRINTNGDGEIQLSEAIAFKDTINTANNKSINSLTGLEAFTNLKGLAFWSTRMKSISISANTALEHVSVIGNMLTSLDISACTELLELKCPGNKITVLDLTYNTKLQKLDCSRNVLTNLNLSANKSLRSLYCYVNSISLLDLSANIDLQNLDCNQNRISFFDLSKNTALKELSCNLNGLKSLNLPAGKALTSMDCHYNSLTSLDVSSNSALQSILCNGNNLTSLDVSACPELLELNCLDNQLTNLNVSTNTVLQILACASNQLTDLDVSPNKALQILYCTANQLKSLNMKNGMTSLLTTFDATKNPELSCIQVDDAAYATSKWTTKVDPSARFNETCTVGVIENPNDAVSIFPNPGYGIFTVSGLPSDIQQIDIYNLWGETVCLNVTQLNHTSCTIDITDAPAGIYLVNMKIGKKVITKRVEILRD